MFRVSPYSTERNVGAFLNGFNILESSAFLRFLYYVFSEIAYTLISRRYKEVKWWMMMIEDGKYVFVVEIKNV